MVDPREAAVFLARKGLRVFRTNSASSRPMKPRFWEYASADPERVYRDFTGADGEPSDDNIAVLTGDSLLVVDIDVKAGKEGLVSLAALEAQGLSRSTFTVRTPSGGLHLYYRVDPAFEHRNRVGWRPGVDIRGEHGFVHAPGSARPDGGEYTIQRDAPIARLADSLAQETRQGRRAPGAIAAVTDRFEDDWALATATEYLKSAEPGAGPGNHHDPLIRIAHNLFDMGITPDTAAALIAEHWPPAPNLSEEIDYQLAALAETRRRDGKVWGSANPAMVHEVFEVVELSSGVTAARARRAYMFADEAFALALNDSVEPLVEDWFSRGALSCGFGPPGVGKSFVAVNLAMSIAAGAPWAGRPTCQGLAFYLALEGGYGMRRRLAALKARMALPPKVPFVLAGDSFDLSRGRAGADALIAAIKEAEQESGSACQIVVIDTVARAMGGVNENDAAEMGAFVRRCDRIRAATGAHVLLIHHSGKDIDKGARGSTVLLGAVDTELRITRGKIEALKQREMEEGAPLHFSLETVALGVDAKGRAAASKVALVGSETVSMEPMTPISLLSEGGLTWEEWRRKLILAKFSSEDHVARLMKKLKLDGSVWEYKGKWISLL